MKRYIFISAIVLSSALSNTAWAHGSKEGDDHAEKAEVVKEQKPWGIAGDAADVSPCMNLCLVPLRLMILMLK